MKAKIKWLKSQFKMIKYEAHLAEAEIIMTVKWLLGLFPKQRKNTLWIFFPLDASIFHQCLSMSKSSQWFTGVGAPGSRAELKGKTGKWLSGADKRKKKVEWHCYFVTQKYLLSGLVKPPLCVFNGSICISYFSPITES